MSDLTDSRLDPALQYLSSKVTSAEPLMKSLAGILNYAIEENFNTQGSRLPGGWPQLAPATIKQRISKHLWPGKILDRHGASGLVGSIAQKWTDTSAQAGTNKVYAAILNFGGTTQHAARTEIFERLKFKKGARKGKFKKLADDRAVKKGMAFKAYMVKIPPRPFLKLNSEDVFKINTAVYSYLKKR